MITERAMLAAVHISIWTAVKHDRKISRDVANQNGAHQGAGRYNKQLLRGAEKLDELRTLAGQVRQYFYKITLPWSDEGFRLLPSNLYFDLTARMREFEAQLLDGTVGQAASAELLAFLRLFRQLPSIDEILLNPETAPLPAETSAQIAIATALGRAMTDNSVARGLKYLDRMPTEMRVMAMRDAAVRDTAITHTPEFVRFGVQHSEAIQ